MTRRVRVGTVRPSLIAEAHHERAVTALVLGECQGKLLEIIRALGAPGGFAGGLDSWQKRYQDGDNGDD